MGYSSRYHVASLAAVFLALAVGILIGSEVGGEVLNSTRQDLERSLTEDLDESRGEVRDLRTQIERADEFGAAVLPSLVSGRLKGQRVGLVSFGSLPEAVVDPVDETLRAAGARLVATGALRLPPDREGLADALADTRFSDVDRSGASLSRYGVTVGREMVRGGPVLTRTEAELFTDRSGRFGGLDGVVLYRDGAAEGGAGSERLSRSVVRGLAQTRADLAAVDLSDAAVPGLGIFRAADISTVDSVDLYSGRLAMVYLLRGAKGSFGVSGDSDRLLPQPLIPSGRD